MSSKPFDRPDEADKPEMYRLVELSALSLADVSVFGE